VCNLRKIRVHIRVKGVGKEAVYRITPVDARRQADAVYNDQGDFAPGGAFIKVG